MGLDCIPQPYDERGKPCRDSNGLTHEYEEPCPFEDDEHPRGFFGVCCWLRGKVAAAQLNALGETALCERMYQDMNPQEARSFARELTEAVDKLEQEHADDAEKPKGAFSSGTWNRATQQWDNVTYSTFEEALASIREAARWYEKVGQLGFGVHAWY